MPQIFFKQVIHPLRLSIRLRMICCEKLQLRPQRFKEEGPKPFSELRISIIDYILRNTKVFNKKFREVHEVPLNYEGIYTLHLDLSIS